MLRKVRQALLGLAVGLLAVGPAAAEPALWVVKDADSTIYLFGTVHFLKPGTDWHSPKIGQAVSSSDELVLEIADGDDAAKMQPLLQSLGFDVQHPLSSRIPAKDKPRLAAAAQALGAPPAAMELMRPWLAALTLSVLPAVRAGYDPQSGVEQALTGEAKALGHPVRAFETTEQQLKFLADLPEPVQVQFLSSTLDEVDESVAQLDALVAAWQAGDLKALEHEFVDSTKADYPAIYQVLVVRRNQAWADALKAKLAGSGVSFVAVGAGHLVGPDSVQAELKKRGIVAERVN